MKIAILSANIGRGDPTGHTHVRQEIPTGWALEYRFISDSMLKPRPLSLSPRMQSKLPKMCGADYAPDADMIIWIDAAYRIIRSDFVVWMLDRLGDGEICLMPHYARKSVEAEAAYIRNKMDTGSRYLLARCGEEPIEEQVRSYLSDKTFKDDYLAAAGCFIYRNNEPLRAMLKDWLVECIKWSSRDQLSLPYVLQKHKIVPRWLEFSVFNCPYLAYEDNRRGVFYGLVERWAARVRRLRFKKRKECQ